MGALKEHDPPQLHEGGTARGGADQGPGWPTKRTRLVDAVVVVAVLVYNIPIQFASLPAGLWNGAGLVLSLGLCVPYLWRLRYPRSVFGLIFGVAALQLALGVELLVADVMLLLALYNVASSARWKVAVPAGLAVVVWLLIAGMPLISKGYLSIGELGVLLLAVVWVCTWGVLVGTRRKYMEALRTRAAQLEREREAQARAAAAKERARIAREIHDVVSHNVGAVGIMADGAAAKARTDPDRAREAMLRVRDTSRKALGEMRTMLGVLRSEDTESDGAPRPGLDQVEALIGEFRALGLPVEFATHGQRPAGVTAGVGLASYRVIQESLTNVRKHAGPVSSVQVSLTYRSDELDIRVVDDGRGHSEQSCSETAGAHGLVGMHERVQAYDGRLEAGMRPAGGYQVRAWLPVHTGEEDQL